METLARQEGIILQIFTSKKYQYLKGESVQRWEIKLDRRCTETNQLSIEIAEKRQASQKEWVKSGIYRGDSWLYIQGNYEVIYIFFTHHLRMLHKTERLGLIEDESPRGKPTVKKFYLPFDTANKYGHRIEINKLAEK